MPSTTGIELSPDSCVLVRAHRARGGAEVSALHMFDRLDWPTEDAAIAETLSTIRRRKGFPRTARVVVWGLPHKNVAADNPFMNACVKPVLAAGFRVESVMSPPEALVALARMRPRPTGSAAVWLALNMQGAAIAVVSNGRLLYSRMFDWAYRRGVVGTREELLRRYLLVAHLAPEVHRGISEARASYGVVVDGVVTCGNLPELRSLTMPLIEELDLEVETLDSTEGLVPVSKARVDRFVESAPALRLACAAATTELPRRRVLSRPLQIAAGLAIVAAGSLAAFKYWEATAPRSADGPAAPATAPTQTLNSGAAGPVAAAPAKDFASVAGTAGPGALQTPPASSATSRREIATSDPAATAATQREALQVPQALASRSAGPSSSPRVLTPPDDVARAPSSTSRSLPTVQAGSATSYAIRVPDVDKEHAPVRTAPRVAQTAPPVRSSATVAAQRVPGDATTSAPSAAPTDRRVPLDAPTPVIDSILIAHDRRLAIIGRTIVRVGDTVGPRVVVAIERDSVVFREPSGFELRVPLKGRPNRP